MNARLRLLAILVLLLLVMSGCGPIVDGQKADPNPDAMIEEGMKMSMEDMEDLIQEMRGKVGDFKKTKGRGNAFKELE